MKIVRLLPLVGATTPRRPLVPGLGGSMKRAASLATVVAAVLGGLVFAAAPAPASTPPVLWAFGASQENCFGDKVWIAPATGTYHFELSGGAGGGSGSGGNGGTVSGDLFLTKDTRLFIEVGTRGDNPLRCGTDGHSDVGNPEAPRNGGGRASISIGPEKVMVAGGGGGGGTPGGQFVGGRGGSVDGPPAGNGGSVHRFVRGGSGGLAGTLSAGGAGGAGGALGDTTNCDPNDLRGGVSGNPGTAGTGGNGGRPVHINGIGTGANGGGGYFGGGGGGSGAVALCTQDNFTNYFDSSGGGGGAGSNYVGGTAGYVPTNTTAGPRTGPGADDNGIVNDDGRILITLPVEGPTFTSAAKATWTVGDPGPRNFPIATTGNPRGGVLSIVSGTLPPWLNFVANASNNGVAVLVQTATPTQGAWSVQVQADNGYARATQDLTIFGAGFPAITSTNSALFRPGRFETFTVTTSGFPAPALTATGALPSGVTFADNGNGTATISGTALPEAFGTYPITIRASNGSNGSPTQTFTLTVQAEGLPAFTSPASASFRTDLNETFTVTATGTPLPTFAVTSGSLPSGATLTNNGNGTATIGRSASTSAIGTHEFTIIASNGSLPAATQRFTLTVRAPAPPVITTQPVQNGTVLPSVAATGASAYQWQAQDATGTWTDVPGATGPTLSNVGPTRGTRYRVVVSNGDGAVISDAVTVVVLATTVYVAPNGSDGGGTNTCASEANPCQTIGYAIGVVTENGPETPAFLSLAAGDYAGWTDDSGKRISIFTVAPGVRVTGPVVMTGPGTMSIGRITFDGGGSGGTGIDVCGGGRVDVRFSRFTGWQTGVSMCGGPGTATLRLSTFDGNGTAVSAGAGSTVFVNAVTMVDNLTAVAGAGSLDVTASLFARNGPCAPMVRRIANLSDEHTCADPAADGGSWANRTDLGPLTVADNGGLTHSVLPPASYPGFRRLPAEQFPVPAAQRLCLDVSVDQRGNEFVGVFPNLRFRFERPTPVTVGGVTTRFCDIGSVQRQADDPVVQPQTITFTSTAPANPPVGASHTAAATGGGSPNPVVFSSGTPGTCSVSAAGAVSFTAVGPCTVRADQAGNAGYDPAPQATQTMTVVKASPTIATMASAGGPVGSTPVRDVATVTGGLNPTGSVVFRLFADSGCSAQVFTSTNNVTAGSATSAPDFTPVTVGTFFWTAAYSGDANHNPAVSACGAPNGSVVITKATPVIATVASPGNLVGAPVRDTATLTGGVNPTGNVTFRLFSDAGCNTAVFTSTRPLPGPVTSDWFTPATAGTYRWVATYNGDALNNPVSGTCADPNEAVTLAPFVAPAYTRTITGDLLGPVTVAAGQSVLIGAGARVVGPVTVQPGGALTVTGAKVIGGITADRPAFLSVCGTDVSRLPTMVALAVSNAAVPVRIGDPAAGCAGNRFAGTVGLTANLAVTFGANSAALAVSINNGGPGNTVIKANTVLGSLACAGNTPAPTNAGQPNTGLSKTGQCARL